MAQITMVRIYLTEADKQLQNLLDYLRDELKVPGVTVLRAITGFGESGEIHETSLLELSYDLPLIIEFFDKPEHIAAIKDALNSRIESGHMVSWAAEIN